MKPRTLAEQQTAPAPPTHPPTRAQLLELWGGAGSKQELAAALEAAVQYAQGARRQLCARWNAERA